MVRKTVFLAFTLKNSSVAEFFVALANEMSLNHRVVIFTHSMEEHSLKLNGQIEIKKWPSPRPTRVTDFLYLVKMVRKYRPEIMISNFAAVNLFLFTGFLFKVPQRIAWYHTLYNQLKKNVILKFRKRMIYKFATHIVANSAASKKDLLKNFGIVGSRIVVVHNAITEKDLKNYGNPDKIIYAGRLDAVKGLSTLINAMSRTVKNFSQLKLHIIGDEKTGDEAEKLKEQVRNLELEENIIFRGNMSRDRVLEEFATAWYTVVPSRVEAFGYVVIESFSVGTPVIGSDTTGIAEVIGNNGCGLLFKIQNSADLAEKMGVLLKDHKLRSKMSLNCKRRFRENFELSGTVQHLINTLKL